LTGCCKGKKHGLRTQTHILTYNNTHFVSLSVHRRINGTFFLFLYKYPSSYM